jgi:hypothetical protein
MNIQKKKNPEKKELLCDIAIGIEMKCNEQELKSLSYHFIVSRFS